MHPIWQPLVPRLNPDHLGFIPSFLSLADPRPAREQLDSAYAHGGGWAPFKGFTLGEDKCLHYPGDRPMCPIAETTLRDETIRLYEHSWVVIEQKDGSYEVCRMD